MTVSRVKLMGIALAIFAATAWLYWPAVHGEFLGVDDVEYLRQSERWNGLTWNAVTWAFTSTDSYYQPLVRLSHVVDYQLFGRNPAGHHATSVVVHALNAALVFGFVWTLLGAVSLSVGERLTVALWVSVVFAIHPLQTESVAWMSGRTQLLCTTFCIGSIWAYAVGVRRWIVWTLYTAALLCKPMAVSLPFVMLAIDYYPLRRHTRSGWRRLVWEKAAMIALAAAVGLATMITKSQIGQMISLTTVPLSERVFLAFESLTFYPLKLVWPSHLSTYYPMTFGLSLTQWPVLASVLGVVIVTVVAVRKRQRMPTLLAAWGSYVILVLPVSGLMPVGSQVMATRFAYVAMLPLLLLAAGAGLWVWRHWTMPAARLALLVLLAGQLYVFAARTASLIPDWRNDEAVQRAALVEFPDSELMNRTLAMMLLDQGRAAEALVYAQRDVEVAPQLWQAHMTLGSALARLGRQPEAMAQHEQAFRMNPDTALAQYNFAVALADAGRIPEAISHYEEALRIKPDYAEAHVDLGVALVKMGKPDDAIRHYQEALRLRPDNAEAHIDLGNLLLKQGQGPEAIAHYEAALRINPDSPQAHVNLGVALAQAGRTPEAMQHWEIALKLRPNDAVTHYYLGNALQGQGRVPEAVEHYQQALRLRPDFAPAGNALARLGAGQ